MEPWKKTQGSLRRWIWLWCRWLWCRLYWSQWEKRTKTQHIYVVWLLKKMPPENERTDFREEVKVNFFFNRHVIHPSVCLEKKASVHNWIAVSSVTFGRPAQLSQNIISHVSHLERNQWLTNSLKCVTSFSGGILHNEKKIWKLTLKDCLCKKLTSSCLEKKGKQTDC